MTKPPVKSAKPKAKKPTPPKSSRFTTESVLRDVHRAIEGKNFESIEELNAYLASMAGPGLKQSLRDATPLTPKEEAQELAFEAMEAETEEQARKLAKRALAKDPDCVDALVVLTGIGANSPKQAIEGLQKAVAAGERSLGTKFFKENKGHFWGVLETRPFMRARQQLAELLRGVGCNQDAIAHYAAMLELNPGDNQGVRDPLLGAYLTVGDLESARALLKDFEDDAMATFAWGFALERYLSGDLEGASAALKAARKQNRFVELYLTGQKAPPKEMPDSYMLGSEEEAIICLENLAGAWAEHTETAFWLAEQLLGNNPPKLVAGGTKSKRKRSDQ
jgi:tetratricopeptide (TPR) repeat protein